jgi:hypothetical protein
MKQWRLQIRNKIDDSNIEEPVRALKDSGDEEVKALAQEVCPLRLLALTNSFLITGLLWRHHTRSLESRKSPRYVQFHDAG